MARTSAIDGDESTRDVDADVVVVGGGPAGCAAGVFTARDGLGTIVFDRGRSSLARCAYLENYLGFPGGIDIETFTALAHDHAESEGCEILPERVESVGRSGEGFRVRTDDGRSMTATRVIAATKYDGEYLRGLDDDEAMFDSQTHGGEVQERFSRDYAGHDGRTPIDGLYIAGPLAGVGDQALIAAGHGAQVACELIEDVRCEAGYWDDIAEYYDWVRRESELNGEWADPDRWRAWFDEQVPDDLDLDADEATIERLRERYIEDRFSMYISTDERAERTAAGHRRLASQLDLEKAIDSDADIDSEDGVGLEGGESQ